MVTLRLILGVVSPTLRPHSRIYSEGRAKFLRSFPDHRKVGLGSFSLAEASFSTPVQRTEAMP